MTEIEYALLQMSDLFRPWYLGDRVEGDGGFTYELVQIQGRSPYYTTNSLDMPLYDEFFPNTCARNAPGGIMPMNYELTFRCEQTNELVPYDSCMRILETVGRHE